MDSATIQRTGLENDRRWMVVSDAGRYLSQKELPRLALVVVESTPYGLFLTAPEMPVLRVHAEAEGPSLEVTCLGDRVSALDAGAKAADWFSQFLDRPARLVRFDPQGSRPLNPEWTNGSEAFVEFSDGFPLLLISQASLQDLNTRLDVPLPMNRFRPNVVLDGLEAYDEDRIFELRQGDLRLRMALPCPRCRVTTTDQLTGESSSAEPLTTLKSYRWSKDKNWRGAMFGRYAIVNSGAGTQLHVGRRLEIEWN